MGHVKSQILILQGWLGGVSEEACQIGPQISDSDPKSLCQPTDRFRPWAALLSLNKAQEWPGNTSLLADFVPREPLCVDVFGDIHTELLHYVNFYSKEYFT
ncbi:hypothetical protein PhaeoP24_01221 [Phaeobacter inhibens]|nr:MULTISPECIES: hypothetical protein [Phaeobacter]AUQ64411.1 hypothetical protein PhaeoP51_03480 [Phaeobacter inhibens]AUQ74780.1 hypothetical protein PhaeoP71_01919 [Phaeobacter piscinae]AUQ89849.1 hypothetical protein PhaeoP24_01221 [Phaeobacter inhibens]